MSTTTGVDFGGIITTALAGFQTNLTDAAPALLGIGVVVFGIPFVWGWARRLIS